MPSYVKTQHIFTVPVAQLRTCNFSPHSSALETRLTRESYVTLAEVFALPPVPWVSTATLEGRLKFSLPQLRDAARGDHLAPAAAAQRFLSSQAELGSLQRQLLLGGRLARAAPAQRLQSSHAEAGSLQRQLLLGARTQTRLPDARWTDLEAVRPERSAWGRNCGVCLMLLAAFAVVLVAVLVFLSLVPAAREWAPW